ncbi:hypothetical protein CSPAE12_00960 [Colletotrichum incanum]|nr:hypothetical protein CSPAE12_00960 [Colletotrichum incanum]
MGEMDGRRRLKVTGGASAEEGRIRSVRRYLGRTGTATNGVNGQQQAGPTRRPCCVGGTYTGGPLRGFRLSRSTRLR